MPDRNIPYYNLILKRTENKPCFAPLSDGFTFRMFEPGDEAAWARLEYAIGDFLTLDAAEDYFRKRYLPWLTELQRRCVFAVHDSGEIIGTCTAWHDYKGTTQVASLHWLVVLPEYRGLGVGKALCSRVMEIFHDFGESPIYIHTQPWSYPAVMLYTKMGFKIMKTDTFSDYENQYVSAMDTLQTVLSAEAYEMLHNLAE